MSCKKHGFRNDVYCPVCDLEQVAVTTAKKDPQPTPGEEETTGLLPCPFCGGEPEILEGDERWCQVGCKNCSAKGTESMLDWDKAISGWNRRTLSPAHHPQELVEALEEVAGMNNMESCLACGSHHNFGDSTEDGDTSCYVRKALSTYSSTNNDKQIKT